MPKAKTLSLFDLDPNDFIVNLSKQDARSLGARIKILTVGEFSSLLTEFAKRNRQSAEEVKRRYESRVNSIMTGERPRAFIRVWRVYLTFTKESMTFPFVLDERIAKFFCNFLFLASIDKRGAFYFILDNKQQLADLINELAVFGRLQKKGRDLIPGEERKGKVWRIPFLVSSLIFSWIAKYEKKSYKQISSEFIEKGPQLYKLLGDYEAVYRKYANSTEPRILIKGKARKPLAVGPPLIAVERTIKGIACPVCKNLVTFTVGTALTDGEKVLCRNCKRNGVDTVVGKATYEEI